MAAHHHPARPVAKALPDVLAPWGPRIEAEIRSRLAGPVLPGISEGVAYQLGSGGKRLRPVLTLWVGEILGAAAEAVFPFALAVEVLHNVFLIHDDIEDGDTYRRGRPTLWAHLGVADALNVADHLLAECYRLIGETPRPATCRLELYEVFTQAFRTTVEGQALDIHGRADPEFTLARYDEVIRKKTGRYLAFGWVGASLIAGRTMAEASTFYGVGDELGPAFQIRDDILDLSQGKGRGGEVGCDIREGKPSFLFAHSLTSPEVRPEERERLLEIHARSRDETTGADVDWVIDLYRRCGAIAQAESEARRRMQKGIEEFSRIPYAPPSAVQTFREIAEFIVERNV